MLKCKKTKNPRISKTEKLGFYELCKFGKSVTVHEIMNYLVITDVPCKVFLKYAVSECVAEFVDDSVETGFGGVRLPTAVKDTNELVTDLSNLVAVKVHSGHTFVVINSGVAHAPIGVVLDGGVHEFFNLTHVMLSSVDSVREKISGDSVVVDIFNLLTDCRGQSDALCLNEIVAHLQVGLHVLDESNESGRDVGGEHGRLVEYLRSMAKIGVNCNPWWTVRQVSPDTLDTQVCESRLSQHVYPLVCESLTLLINTLSVSYTLGEHQLITALGSDGDVVGVVHVNS